MSNLERIYKAIDNDLDYFKNYSSYLGELLTFVDYKVISDVVNSILKARENEKAIYFAGNGGSAATAAHFAQDLGGVGRKAQAEGFRTCSLTDNVSLITALGNDYGYDKIFSVQVEEKFKYGDVLLVISASGNSPNIINAVASAKKIGGTTIGLVGFDGGKLANMCDHTILVKSQKGEYGPVEDMHMILNHMIISYLILYLKETG
jgi:D-sedoheptulose 7-phosphate isomerase|tara:strand:- start:2260 stop:2874 length:615 start_codon:yes stop_codon:yes gene_type:complete